MISLIKRLSYKILIISMITVVLSFFSVSSVSHAKLTLEDGEYYYSGVQEAEVTWEATFGQKIINAFKQVANYLLGIITVAFRGVVIGWIEIMEILLTAILGVDLHPFEYISRSLSQINAYEQDIVNIEKIIFDRVDVLDINIFKTLEEENKVNNQKEIEQEPEKVMVPDEPQKDPAAQLEEKDNEESKGEKILNLIREAVAKWYYILRLVVIAFMLLVLIFIGIKMAISTIASDKAVYKRMLVDWVVGMTIVFMIHYFMIIIINVNESIVNVLSDLSTNRTISKEYQYGEISNVKSASEIETTLYESARTRAYSLSFTDGFTGLIIYGALVYYAWKFALIYFRRLLNIMILTVMAPVVAGSYAINKAMSGKAIIFTTWFKEYIMNVIIQLFHAIIYVTFISIALNLSLVSLVGAVMALILLNFMSKSDKLLRELFKVTGGVGALFGEMAEHTDFKSLKSQVKGLRSAVMGGTIGKQAIKMTTRVATKPARKFAENKFVNYMLKKVSSEDYYKKGKEEQKSREEIYHNYRTSKAVTDKETELQTKKEDFVIKQAKLKDKQRDLKEKYKKEEIIKQKEIDTKRKKLEVAKHKLKKKFLDESKSKKSNKTLLHNLNKKIKENEDKIQAVESERENITEKQKQIREEIRETNKEIKDVTAKLEMVDQEIAEFENMIDNEFLNYYIANTSSWDVIKKNINGLFDPEQYLEKNDDIITEEDIEIKAKEMFKDYEMHKSLAEGKEIPSSYTEDEKKKAIETAEEKIEEYKARAQKALLYNKTKKTKREGDSDKAFWRKKKSSVGKTFFDNAKLDKILGLSAEESKLLKEDIKFKKDILTGVASGIVGTALAGINPGLGLLLLSNASSMSLQTLSRNIQLKNVPITYNRTFKFKGFTPHTQKEITRNFERLIEFSESQMAKENAKKHDESTEESFNDDFSTETHNTVTFGTENGPFSNEKKYGANQEKLRKILNQIMLLDSNEDFEKEYSKYMQQLKNILDDKDLAVEDLLDSENAILVGDSVVIFKDYLPYLNIDANKKYKERLKDITNLIKNNKSVYIRNAIIQLAIAKGVTDVNNLYLSDVDITEVQESIKHIFESKGEVRKGDLKLERIVNQKNIENVLGSMKDTPAKTYNNNHEIAIGMLKKVCFDYMKKNGVTDKYQLNSESAKKEIEQMLKIELMTKESKQSDNVISQQNGTDNFKMPVMFQDFSSLISQVMNQTGVKKISDIRPIVGQEAKEQAIERMLIREENKIKNTQKKITKNSERRIGLSESQITKSNAKKHEKFTEAIFNDDFSVATRSVVTLGTGMFLGDGISSFTSEKLDRIYQKKLREELKSARKELNEIKSLDLREEYETEYAKYSQKLKASLEEKDLRLQEILNSENAMIVGDSVIKFKDNLPDVNIDANKAYEERVEDINNLIKNNKSKYIRNAIIQLAIAKGVTDMNDLYLSEVDRIEIQESIKHIFESKGEVKKGDLKLEKIINQKNIEKVLGSMKDTPTKAYNNNQIAIGMVKKVCFDYMQRNRITDKNKLTEESAKKEIEQMLKFELMTKESKQSYNVISQLNGGQDGTDKFKMPGIFQNLSLLISQVMNQTKVKKTSDIRPIVGQKAKEQAIERNLIREENKTKTNLQTAVYTGNMDIFSEEDEDPEIQERKLKLLFLLQELQKVNREAYKVEGKTTQKKEETLLEMRYQQRKENGYDTDYEDEYYTDEDLMPRERELNILLHGKNDILKIINN